MCLAWFISPYMHNNNSPLRQRSPTVLAPGTGLVENNFSTDGGRRGGDGSGGNASDGERWGRQGTTGSDGEQWGATGSDGERRGAMGNGR